MQIIDAVNPLIVQSITLTVPPTVTALADLGKRWIPAAGATGLWAGHDGEIAVVAGDDVWQFISPVDGWRASNLFDDVTYKYDGSAWIADPGSGSVAGTSVGFQMVADLSSTTDADPGPGNLRWNNAAQGSATQLFLDDLTADAADLGAMWAALRGGGFLYLQHATDQDTWQIWELTSVTDAAGYVKLGVNLLAQGNDFAASDDIRATLDQGPPVAADRRTVTDVASASGVVTLDYSLGDYFRLPLSENVTSWVITNPPGSGKGFTLMVEVTQDTTPRTVAKPGTSPGGTFDVPTGSGVKFVIAISSFDNGSTLRSNVSGDAYS